jgi:hypothetical protein
LNIQCALGNGKRFRSDSSKHIKIHVTPCSSSPVFHNYYDTNVSHNTKLESFFKWICGHKFNIGPLLGIDLYFKNKMA